MSSHRGLSAVVGTVFLIAVVIGALSYVSYSMDVLGNFSESLIVEESRQRDKQAESFEISSIDLSTSTLNGVIKNSGELPVELTTLYIDVQGEDDVVQKYTLDAEIAPGSTIDLLDFATIPVDSTKGYNMKVVSSRGAVNSFYVNSNGQENINIKLIAIPESVIPGFETTLIMTVVNNMSNNNMLVNLTPENPLSSCSSDPDCTLTSPVEPTSYDVLDSGDIAIFKWTYELDGVEDDTFTFRGAVQNGVSGNYDEKTITLEVPEFAEHSGVALESLGFGQSETIENVLVLHTESGSIPDDGDHQMSPIIPDDDGDPDIVFDGIAPWLNGVDSDSLKFYSANVTTTDAHFPAGTWNASLRYTHDPLPTGMDAGAQLIWADGTQEGIKLHFEDISPASGIYISTEDVICNALETGTDTGVTGDGEWSATAGVNGSGAYIFDGDGDYLTIEGTSHDVGCGNPHNSGFSLAAWFKSTAAADNDDIQVIIEMYDDVGSSGDWGGYKIELGDGSSGNRGTVYFTSFDENNLSQFTDCDSGATDYADGEWHHVAVQSNASCEMWIDSVSVDTGSGASNHIDADEDIIIGASHLFADEFWGSIDDVMFWTTHALDQDDVDFLFGYSFGNNATNMHFTLGNYTSDGIFVNQVAYSNDYGMDWGDPGHYTDEWNSYRGGNYTVTLPDEVRLNLVPDNNRLAFTMDYASGEILDFHLDDSDLTGAESEEYSLSSYLQPPTLSPDQNLPVFYSWDNTLKTVSFFAFNAGDEGSWFTHSGTRIVFNGTNGAYAGMIKTIDGVTMTSIQDSGFVSDGGSSDFIFHAPQSAPDDGFPTGGDIMPEGTYAVTIFINGYDEGGTIFVRSITLGEIEVV